jgi:hypothetical protein
MAAIKARVERERAEKREIVPLFEEIDLTKRHVTMSTRLTRLSHSRCLHKTERHGLLTEHLDFEVWASLEGSLGVALYTLILLFIVLGPRFNWVDFAQILRKGSGQS